MDSETYTSDSQQEENIGSTSHATTSSYTSVEICLKRLHRIPGHIKGRSSSTKESLATENLRVKLELEKERSKALEEEIRMMKEEQFQFQREDNHVKDKVEFLMDKLGLKISW